MKRLILASNVFPFTYTNWRMRNTRIEKTDEQTISGLQNFYKRL